MKTVLYIFLFCMLLLGCKGKVDYVLRADFNYINGTADPVRISLKGGVINSNKTDTIFYLPSGDTLTIRRDGETADKNVDVSDFRWSALVADTTKVIFKDTLCYKESNFSGPILQNAGSHTYEKKAWNYFVFYYTIDNTLLNMATKCQ
jgi:hypothetical protein